MLAVFENFKVIIKSKSKIAEIRAGSVEDVESISSNLDKIKEHFPDYTFIVTLESKFRVDNLEVNELDKFKNHVGQKLKLFVKVIEIEEKPTRQGGFMYPLLLELPGKRKFVKGKVFSKVPLYISKGKYYVADGKIEAGSKQYIKKNEQMLGKEVDYQFNISAITEHEFEEKNEVKYETPRSELHAHTKYSKNDAFMDPKAYRKAFEENKVKTLAITDHGATFAFNEFVSGLKDLKDKGKKLILGSEFYSVDIEAYKKEVLSKLEKINNRIYLIESSDYSIEIENIEAEIEAARGQRDSHKRMSSRKTISDEEREEAVAMYEKAVADISELNARIKELKSLMKDDEAELISLKNDKEYLMAEYENPNDVPRDHLTVLVKTPDEEIDYRGSKLKINKGLVQLYKLISTSYLEYFSSPVSSDFKKNGKRPTIPYSVIMDPEVRKHFVINSACAFGKHMKLAIENRWEEFEEWVKQLDAVELHPIHNNIYMLTHEDYPTINTEEDLFKLHRDIYSACVKVGTKVIFASDAHVNDKEDRDFRSVFKEGYITAIKKRVKETTSGADDDFAVEKQPYIMSYEDMVEDLLTQGFSHEEIKKINEDTDAVADMCQNAFDMTILPKKLFLPDFPNVNVKEEIPRLAWEFAINKWSKDGTKEGIDKKIADRLEEELQATASKGFEVLYYIAYWMCRESENLGYIVGSRGSAGSMLTTYVLGVGENNPLPAHHLCPKCKNITWSDNSDLTGLDLPDIKCSACGENMEGDGLNIEAHNFTGKLDLNV